MLSIGKLVAGAEDYYLSMVAEGQEEYYTGAGESPGTWLGAGTDDLGLAGEVRPEALAAILAGMSPGTGVDLGLMRRSGTRVGGFDLTFSAPKSVSLLYALGSPVHSTAVRAAHDQAVTEGVAYLERHALFARRGTDGLRRIRTTGLVAAAFVHRTSRNGDPQLHTHVLAANAVLGEDGRWSAPDARGFYAHARTAGFVYQASLRAGLVESLGIAFGPVRRGAAEIEGVDPTVLRRFSTRRAEIEDYLFHHGGPSSGRTAELAALATRSPKPTPLGPDDQVVDLRAQWRLMATERGVDLDRLFPDFRPARAVSLDNHSSGLLSSAVLGSTGLTAEDSSFSRRDAVRAVAERLVDGAHLDAIEAVVEQTLGHPEAVSLGGTDRAGEPLYSTDELLALEADLLERSAAPGLSAAAVTLARAEEVLASRPELSGEQRAMVASLVTSGRPIEVVVGKAGAGKTTALSLAREIFEGSGFEISGTALSARAAEELEASAGIPSATLTRFTGELESGRRTLSPRDVVVVDEAGMVGTRTLAKLVGLSEESGAKLVLVGDPRQLPEIAAGGAFAALAARPGILELTENRRQHELWERSALDQLRSGDVSGALASYERHGRIRLSDTMAEARSDLIVRWLAAREGGDDALMLAVNRRDVSALNLGARAILQSRGTVGSDLTEANGRAFAPGDEVVCLRNARRLGVINGTRGTVVGLEGTDLVIDVAGTPRLLPTEYLSAGHLDYGYATTVHKSQGATYGRAFVLATESLTKEAGYVAMSRARISTELFVGGGAFEQGLGPEVKEVEPLSRTAARLAVSRAKVLASSHLEEQSVPRQDRLNTPVPERTRQRGSAAGRLPLVPATGSADDLAGHPATVALGATDFTATDFSGPEPPAHIVAALGPRPFFVDEQGRYDQLTQSIDRYRSLQGVEGDDPLGSRPFETFPRLAYDAVAAEVARYERRRWREREGPELGMGR
jgi:conjugative relaxase-like TrwC/TraI family protein